MFLTPQPVSPELYWAVKTLDWLVTTAVTYDSENTLLLNTWWTDVMKIKHETVS